MPDHSRHSCLRNAILVMVTVLLSSALSVSLAATGAETQERMSRDLSAGQPVVVHVIVALADNANQGIVPVSQQLGNGQEPRTNLYWGALYGVRTYLARQGGWSKLPVAQPVDTRIRERVLFFSQLQRKGKTVPVYIVADAWDGAAIKPAIERFLTAASGDTVEKITFRQGARDASISAGGSAHLLAFVGHNGLMDFAVSGPDKRSDQAAAGSSIVLACSSKSYFHDKLHAAGSHPLLLTTGLMAPEAYTLDAAIRSWIAGSSVAATREAAATAYHKYQKSGLRGARSLFWGESP